MSKTRDLYPDLFSGETCHLLGGGPSIRNLDLQAIEGDRVIAINNAGLDVYPEADILFAMDERWFNWNRDRLHLNRSRWRVVRFSHKPSFDLPWPLIGIAHDKYGEFSRSLGALAGSSGGAMALNLAALLGASRIVLHGFDMRPGNYHSDHRVATPDKVYPERFIPSFEKMAPHLADLGIDVFNATPGSALTCFPQLEPPP